MSGKLEGPALQLWRLFEVPANRPDDLQNESSGRTKAPVRTVTVATQLSSVGGSDHRAVFKWSISMLDEVLEGVGTAFGFDVVDRNRE